MKVDTGEFLSLVLLDISSTFDTVDHNIIIERLETLVDISRTALWWFPSYFSNKECVSIDGFDSSQAPSMYGVPQGSVLGPILFSLYLLPLGQIIKQQDISFHCYTNYTQLYSSRKPSESVILPT